MTLGSFISDLRGKLTPIYGADEARAIAVMTASEVLGVAEYRYISDPGMKIPRNMEEKLTEIAKKLAEGCPVQYALGYSMFAGLKIKVGPGVLIPRPETEELFNLAADELDTMIPEEFDETDDLPVVLDICTGSGCLAYAFASDFPVVQLYGCDISNEALRYACRQKVKLEGPRPIFFSADVLGDVPAGLPKADMIVCNPPYVMESERGEMRDNVLLYEPESALFVSDEEPLVFYRALKSWAEKLLRPGGVVWMEINGKLGRETLALFPGGTLHKDFSGRDRFVRWQPPQE